MIVCKSSGEYEKEGDGCVENVDTSHVLVLMNCTERSTREELSRGSTLLHTWRKEGSSVDLKWLALEPQVLDISV
jgi:hypothetical protein